MNTTLMPQSHTALANAAGGERNGYRELGATERRRLRRRLSRPYGAPRGSRWGGDPG